MLILNVTTILADIWLMPLGGNYIIELIFRGIFRYVVVSLTVTVLLLAEINATVDE